MKYELENLKLTSLKGKNMMLKTASSLNDNFISFSFYQFWRCIMLVYILGIYLYYKSYRIKHIFPSFFTEALND